MFGAFLAIVSMSFSTVNAGAQQMTVSKNGNTILASISAPSLTGTQCCLGLSLDGPGGASCTQPCPHATKSDSWTCNSVGTHTVIGCWLSSETNYQYACTSQSIEILQSEAAQPSPTCPLFDLFAGNKVLTHLYDPTDIYPPGQVQDAQMQITIKARRANPGSTIYLQVTDPPDTASYGAPHLKNDNTDISTQNVGTIGGQQQITMTLPPSGQTTTLVLTTSPWAAGDNYEIIGSTDPQLLSDPAFQCTDCPDSGIITVWKRAYLETDRMFRTGAMLTQNAPAGSTVLSVDSVSGFVAPKGKKPGSSVVLAHASLSPGGVVYYEPGPGDPPLTVKKVNGKKGTIELSRPLAHSYFVTNDLSRPWRSDGIGVVTGFAASDFYTPNAAFLAALFAQAFIEVVPVHSNDQGYIPYTNNFTAANNVDLVETGQRWFRNYGKPNVIAALGGTRSVDDLGDRVIPFRFAWTFVAKVESAVSSSNSLTLNGESTTHELTHTWDVNQLFNNGGHCDQDDYQNGALRCLMRPGSDWTDAGVIRPEYYDGRVMYHFNVTAADPSEFLNLRTHSEPLQ